MSHDTIGHWREFVLNLVDVLEHAQVLLEPDGDDLEQVLHLAVVHSHPHALRTLVRKKTGRE